MLEGIRIVEIEGLGPGPFAGMLFADLGAEVIVVHRSEPPPGTPERSLLDRGKRSIALDLKRADDGAALQKLIATADGLIEGFRPGVMEKLGLGPDVLCAAHPRLVYGRVTGWGQDGPMAGRAGHDLNYVGVAGALWYASPPGIAPQTPPTLVGDIGGGALYLVAGMLAALLRVARGGEGTIVDAAIVDGSAHMLNLLMAARAAGLLGAGRGSGVLDGAPWSRCYACADGGWLAVQCLEAKFYAEFLAKLGVAGDAAFARDPDPAGWEALAGRIADIIAGRTQGEWASIFADSDACVAPVLEPTQAAAHPQLVARGTWIEVGGQLQARAAPRFGGAVPDEPALPPRRGEHTREILADLPDQPREPRVDLSRRSP